jgi:hypothetical protein
MLPSPATGIVPASTRPELVKMLPTTSAQTNNDVLMSVSPAVPGTNNRPSPFMFPVGPGA